MKTPTVLKTCGFLAAASFLGFSSVRADEQPASETSIQGEIADGTPPPASPPPETPDFAVESEIVFPLKVDEPPELPGVPGVKGIADAVVQLVEDPGLPDPLPSGDEETPQSGTPGDPPPAGQNEDDSSLLYVSATVFNHSWTLVTCNTGEPGATAVLAWSNLDFNHFGGFTAYQVKGPDDQVRHYNLILSLDNVATPPTTEIAGQTGVPLDLLPVAGALPAFVTAEGGEANTAGLVAIRDMHELYKTEGTRMATACESRRVAETARRADLLANPPVLQGTTLRFWSRTPGLEASGNGGGE